MTDPAVGITHMCGVLQMYELITGLPEFALARFPALRTALFGGMTFGMGMALLEGTMPDPHTGAFVNADLAEYLVPVHADIADIDAIFIDGFDDKANTIGVKGLGELGICGSAAAVANAVFNATGARVRTLPLTPDRVLAHLASARRG